MNEQFGVHFPNQHVTRAEREKADWYANCCDYIIAAGINARAHNNIEEKMNILHDQIPEEYYKKALNPYNAKKDSFTRFPATMRNYDMMKGVVRRYIGEYIKNPHDFIVVANNPEVVMGKDAKLAEEIMRLAEQALAKKIQETYAAFVNEGNDPEQFNVEEQVDIKAFIKEFNENYVDDISVQGQKLIKVIDTLTDSLALYARAYGEFVAYGEFYTYSDVVGTELIKRVVSARDAFPVPNDSHFVEDFDMFAERRMMTKQQIFDAYRDYLTEKDIKYLEDYYKYATATHGDTALLNWRDFYKNTYPDVCEKYSGNEIKTLAETTMARDLNNNLFETWHVVWRGEVRQGILTYSDGTFVSQRIVDEDYEFNPELGDINIEWVWKSQVFESVRIGSRNTAVYPYKARPIAYNRNGKLPYNGLMEYIPGFGKFSIVDIILPYQIFRNIVYYHREMAIAKNKLAVLMIAKSLLGKKQEETIYRMAADGVLYVDDEDDPGGVKMQQVRMLAAGNNDYIRQLSELIDEIKQAALEAVDMTSQRYGEIANSAGKGVTEEAVLRGSMGSVVLEYMFDVAREHDYQRDLDYTKLAWIDGIRVPFRNDDGKLSYLSLDVNSHLFANYIVQCKTSIKERDKLAQYKELAFSAAQNGDLQTAAAAIDGDNTATIKKLIDKFSEANRQHEVELQQMQQQAQEMLQQYELQKIQVKGEEDRKTVQLEKYLDGQIQMIKANANIMSFDNGLSDTEKNEAEQRMLDAKNQIEREKIAADMAKHNAEMNIKEKEIAAKVYDSDNKLKIARANKNKYDK